MNYYIQGDAANADQIKAAFEKLGYDTITNGWNFNADCGVYFTNEADKLVDYTHIKTFVNLIKTHPDYQELELPKHKFGVGDWIVRNNGSSEVPIQIYNIKKDRYLVTNLLGSKGELMINRQDEWHLWSIQDAKDGDVLATNSIICIFKKLDKDGYYIISPCIYTVKDGLEVIDDENDSIGSCGFKPATKEDRELLFRKMKEEGYEWDEKKKELSKIIEPNFKVEDWICPINGKKSKQVRVIEVRGFSYLTEDRFGILWPISFSAQDEWRFWTIQDAKDGDVLVLNGFSKEYKWIGIFKAHTSDTSFSSHCHYNCGMCEFVTDIARCTKHGIKYNDIRPATNEERDILFAKMQEAGYEWDADKKELKKIQKHYDIANFKPFDKVLARDTENEKWVASLFSNLENCAFPHKFVCIDTCYTQCIPFEGNEHLLCTTDMCDEMYINW